MLTKSILIWLFIQLIASFDFLEQVYKLKNTKLETGVPQVEKLSFEDQFNYCPNGKPDPNKWGYEKGFVRNHEDQYYTEDNARCGDGKLVITANRLSKRDKSKQNALYTSSSLTSRGKQEFQYGRFIIRAKIDIRQGSWPAFWTLGTNMPQHNWPQCGEIDIMEAFGGVTLQNLWYGNYGGKQKYQVTRYVGVNSTWAKDFHTWELIWNKKTIQLRLDGKVTNFLDLWKAQKPRLPNPFQQKVWMIANLAIGGSAGGNPKNTKFPVKFEVDYIKVYQSIRVFEANCRDYCISESKNSNGCCEFQIDKGFCVWYSGGIPNIWSKDVGWKTQTCKGGRCTGGWKNSQSCLNKKEI